MTDVKICVFVPAFRRDALKTEMHQGAGAGGLGSESKGLLRVKASSVQLLCAWLTPFCKALFLAHNKAHVPHQYEGLSICKQRQQITCNPFNAPPGALAQQPTHEDWLGLARHVSNCYLPVVLLSMRP